MLLTFEIPDEVVLGKNVVFMHNCFGTVMHPKVTIKDEAVIFHNVTLGRKYLEGDFGGIIVGSKSIICAGAKVLGGEAPLIIGDGCVIAANAVLTQSTGSNELWAGVPARKIKDL